MKTLIDGTEVPFETRTRNTNKGYILLTQAEISKEDAATAKALAEAPMREWEQSMQDSDAELPRWAEDMITAYGTAMLSAETKKKYDDKRALRASKP